MSKKSLPELVPFTFKNGKVRIKTQNPKLDDDGKPIIKNGSVVMNWENKRDDNNKPVYDENVIFITYVPQDGYVIPTSLSKAKLTKLVEHAKTSDMTFLTKPGVSYSKQGEFEPQSDVDSDDKAITTVTVKYTPKYTSACKPMTAW